MLTLVRLSIGITIPLLALLVSLSTTQTQPASITQTQPAADWVEVQGDKDKPCGKKFSWGSTYGKLCGISGMTLLEQKGGRTEFLVVHDIRVGSPAPRLGIVTVGSGSVNYHDLKWPTKNEPSDLEAITSVPGRPEQFLALSSAGQSFPLVVSLKTHTVKLGIFPDPGKPHTELTDVALADYVLPEIQRARIEELEGLSIQKIGDQLVIIWGYRGAGDLPGILYGGLLDPKTMQVKKDSIDHIDIKQTFLLPNNTYSRHIADLKIDVGGVVLASATYDPGDTGPFASGVYSLGTISLPVGGEKKIKLELNNDWRPQWVFARKVEAIEIVPGKQGGIAFGAEDENMGGWLYFKVGEDWRKRDTRPSSAAPK